MTIFNRTLRDKATATDPRDKPPFKAEMYIATIIALRNNNESDIAQAWNIAQATRCIHQDLGNSVEYALSDMAHRFPEFIFTAVSSTTGPVEPRHIVIEGNKDGSR